MKVIARAALPQTKISGKAFNQGQIIKDSDGNNVIYDVTEPDFKFNNERPTVTGLLFEKIEDKPKAKSQEITEEETTEKVIKKGRK